MFVFLAEKLKAFCPYVCFCFHFYRKKIPAHIVLSICLCSFSYMPISSSLYGHVVGGVWAYGGVTFLLGRLLYFCLS